MCVIAGLFLLYFCKYVPFNMDEFGYDHVICCQNYPLNNLNTINKIHCFREACNAYDLALLPDHYLPLRSFAYVGIVQSTLYYPIFLLWHSPHSARLFGLIMLAVQAFLLHRLFKTDILISYIFLLFFMSYSFVHIVDTGPVTFQTTSSFLICYLSLQWAQSLKANEKLSWRYPLSIGIILFLGVWTKLAYFFMLPALILIISYPFIIDIKEFCSPSKLKIFLRDLLILIGSALIPTFILLNSTGRDGGKYYQMIYNSNKLGILDLIKVPTLTSYFTDPLKAGNRIYKFDHNPFSVYDYLEHPLRAVDHIIHTQGVPEGILLIFLGVFFIFWGVKLLRTRNIKTSFIFLNLFCFLLTIFVMSKCADVQFLHHVVLSMPFLVIALFYLYSKIDDRKFKLIFALFFLTINVILYVKLPQLSYRSEVVPSSMIQNNEFLNEKFSDKYVFIVIDWGIYYIKALFGKKNQCVLYLDPLNDKRQIVEIRKVLNKTNRKALFICRTDSHSDLNLLKTQFPSLVKLRTPFDTGQWQIFYEKS